MAKFKKKNENWKLTLTQEEAQVLFDIIGDCVTGLGRRGFSDNIYYAMEKDFETTENKDYVGHVNFKRF